MAPANPQTQCIDVELDDDDDEIAVVGSTPAPVQTSSTTAGSVKSESKVKGELKRELKRELKKEIKPEPKEKKSKRAKVKRERPVEERSGGHRGEKEKESRRRRSRSRSRRRRRSSSSSRSSSEESLSEDEMYTMLKPYSKVQLVGLVRKAEMNGRSAMVVHPSCAVCPCPPGCILVRLDTGREIAVKPKNLAPLETFHVGPQQAPLTQEHRLKRVLETITLKSTTTEATSAEACAPILGTDPGPQGGVGHVL